MRNVPASSLLTLLVATLLVANGSAEDHSYVHLEVTGELTVTGNDGALFQGVLGEGDPIAGPGMRMMWYPRKGAFRAGTVSDTQWDDANIGPYSLAAGTDTTAYAENSFAIGTGTHANAPRSFASGFYSVADGADAIVMGYVSWA
jgi:hypothetical protein